MSRREELEERLAVLRKNLHLHQLQKDKYGSLDMPQRLIHQIEETEAKIRAVEAELAKIEREKHALFSKIPLQPFEPWMIYIPAGPFLMGSDPNIDTQAEENEMPQHYVNLLNYHIAKTPITSSQYAAFIQSTGQVVPDYWNGKKFPPRGKENHPVVEITWYDAIEYCKWLSKVTKKNYTLPSEAEWEKAARGTDGYVWPWGDQWDALRCNSAESRIGDTSSVNTYTYPNGASPYGVLDTAGNVWEWTRSLWGVGHDTDFGYPYDSTDGREQIEAPENTFRVLRGGAFLFYKEKARCTARGRFIPKSKSKAIGFRVVMHPE